MRTKAIIVGCALAVASAWPAIAQYSVSQYVIAGGGGQASGGGWTLNATIGEAAAGTTSGGGMTLTAGFWATQAVQQPQLSIALAGTNVVVSWPSSTVGFVLQQKPSLQPNPVPWSVVPVTPSDNGVVTSVTLPVTGAAMFYRLAR